MSFLLFFFVFKTLSMADGRAALDPEAMQHDPMAPQSFERSRLPGHKPAEEWPKDIKAERATDAKDN